MGLPEYLMFIFLIQCFLQAYCLLKIMRIEKKQQEQLLVQINVELLQEIVNKLIVSERQAITPIVIEIDHSKVYQDKPRKQQVEDVKEDCPPPQAESVESKVSSQIPPTPPVVTEETPKKYWWTDLGNVMGAVRKLLPSELKGDDVVTVSVEGKEEL
jgi:hypothetical protein